MAGRISMGARREVVSAVAERYRPDKRGEKGRILDELCATTGWHRKHAVRALRQRETVMPGEVGASRERRRRYGPAIKEALTELWGASDRVCGKRLKVMIATLLPALERNGRLTLDEADRARVLAISAATIDRLLGDVRVAASGGKRRRAGFYSAIRREVPIRTLPSGPAPTVQGVPFIHYLAPGELFSLLPFAFPAIPLEGPGCEPFPPAARFDNTRTVDVIARFR